MDIITATLMDDTYTVRTLLKSGTNPNTIDQYGMTALMVAAFHGNLEIVRTLLKSGADPKICDRYNNNALTWALINCDNKSDSIKGDKTSKECYELIKTFTK